jgi:hypothetical protein
LTNRTDNPRPELALIFRNAAKVIQGRGHSKGLYEQHTGEVCAVGALMAAEGKTPAHGLNPIGHVSQAVWFLSSRIMSNTVDADPIERIADWNDAPERTASEVVETLLAAAKAIEEREASAVTPVCLRTSDGALWELASVPRRGDPRYVLAGVQDVPPSVFAEYGELVNSFGAVPAGGVSA